MRRALRLSLSVLACVPLALTLPGCGGPRVTPGGRLLDKGQPLQIPQQGLPPGDPGVRVIFLPMEPEKEGTAQQPAVVNVQDATFTVPGNDGRGIAPGKYRISIALGAYGTPDKLKGAFGEKNSPVVRDVTGAEEIVIDVSKPSG